MTKDTPKPSEKTFGKHSTKKPLECRTLYGCETGKLKGLQNQNSGINLDSKQKNLNISKIKDLIQSTLMPVILFVIGLHLLNLLTMVNKLQYGGYPVFIAQHATVTCCRGCIEKWHKFSKDKELTKTELEYLVSIITEWIKRQINLNSIQ